MDIIRKTKYMHERLDFRINCSHSDIILTPKNILQNVPTTYELSVDKNISTSYKK